MTDNERVLVTFQNKRFDITEFVKKHPGGVNTLKGLNNTNMDDRFRNGPPHSKSALYLLQEYEVQAAAVPADVKRLEVDRIETFTEDSMEYLVDWDKPMVQQVASLGKTYTEWVHKPVDRPLRMFGSFWLEILTKTPWWLVPAFWLPIISILVLSNVQTTNQTCYIVLGICLWTLFEYSMHRWVFHIGTESGHPLMITFHFLLHGLHHKVPFDPYRLVFPPGPALIIAAVFYQLCRLLFPHPKLVLAGGLMGYLVYDMIHYYIHHGSPPVGYLYSMKRYHYQHHFVHQDKGFGISTPIWDTIFGTRIFLQKLKYILKW